MKREIITDEERLGSVVFNALVEADFQEEMKRPRSITVYLPSAQFDIENIFSASDDPNHPNYAGHRE